MPKKVDRNSPKSLTTKQRRFVDQLIERFGEQANCAKRSLLKIAAQEILGTRAAPAWITRNMKVRYDDRRGRYDLTVLAKLPVQDPDPDAPKAPRKKTPPKKKSSAPKKNTSAPETEPATAAAE